MTAMTRRTSRRVKAGRWRGRVIGWGAAVGGLLVPTAELAGRGTGPRPRAVLTGRRIGRHFQGELLAPPVDQVRGPALDVPGGGAVQVVRGGPVVLEHGRLE